MNDKARGTRPRAVRASPAAASLDGGDDDLRRLSQLGDKILAESVAEDLSHLFLHLLELGRLSRFAGGNQDQVIAEGRLDRVTHLAGLEGERGLGERLHHTACPWEPVQVAAVFL